MRLRVGIDLLRKTVMLQLQMLREDRLTRPLIFCNVSTGHNFAEVIASYAAYDPPSPLSQQAGKEIKILQQRQQGKGHDLMFVLCL